MAYIGIDLGTTNSAMATLDAHGRAATIPNAEGDLTTPSVVYFESEGDVIVGRHAKRALKDDPGNVVQNIKRHIADDDYRHIVQGQEFSAIAISSLILRKLHQDAERQIGVIDGAVITVPAYFDEGRRQATAAAGELAGLNVIDVLNEPTAAALATAYVEITNTPEAGEDFVSFLNADKRESNVVIYDLGGGTFDVTALQRRGGDLTVLATAGDITLGGLDWTRRIVDNIAEVFVALHEIDPRCDLAGGHRLEEMAEGAKLDLSARKSAPWELTFSGKELSSKLMRREFEQMTADLLYRTENRLSRIMRDAGLDWSQVDRVLAIGGASRMPQVVNMLERVTGKKPDVSLSPEHTVAQGAAIHAGILVANGMLSGEKRSGTKEDEDESTRAPLLEKIASGILHLLRRLRTTNVNAHSLGVVVTAGDGGRSVWRMIPHNTALPANAAKCFGTIIEGQKRVTVEVVEGESEDVCHCLPVGACVITELPPGLPKKSPIEVTFRYDRSGRLHVEAIHATSGAWAKSVIHRSGGIDPEKIHLTGEILRRLTVS